MADADVALRVFTGLADMRHGIGELRAGARIGEGARLLGFRQTGAGAQSLMAQVHPAVELPEKLVAAEALHAGQPAESVIADLFALIQTFTRRYDPAWREYEQQGGSRSMIRQYHGMLAEQFSGYIKNALPAGQQEREPYLARFLAELTIRFGSDVSMTYGMISPAVQKLLSE